MARGSSRVGYVVEAPVYGLNNVLYAKEVSMKRAIAQNVRDGET